MGHLDLCHQREGDGRGSRGLLPTFDSNSTRQEVKSFFLVVKGMCSIEAQKYPSDVYGLANITEITEMADGPVRTGPVVPKHGPVSKL